MATQHVARWLTPLVHLRKRGGRHQPEATCTCGVAGCAGLTRGIEVTHNGQNVRWVIREPGPTRSLVFEGAGYVEAVRQGLAQFEQRCIEHPGMEPVPRQNRYLLPKPGNRDGLP